MKSFRCILQRVNNAQMSQSEYNKAVKKHILTFTLFKI